MAVYSPVHVENVKDFMFEQRNGSIVIYADKELYKNLLLMPILPVMLGYKAYTDRSNKIIVLINKKKFNMNVDTIENIDFDRIMLNSKRK